jgi:large subunit ribosomal protein L29
VKAKEFREMSLAELDSKLKELKSELLNLRFQLAINQLENPHKIKDTKRDIARVLTIIREKKNA